MMKKAGLLLFVLPICLCAQINTDRVMTIARNALYFEDYVLSIQYFNQVINAKPYLYEPYFYRGLAKMYLEDFQGAEADMDQAIQRNPFVVSLYQVRGLARIRLGKFDAAIQDYRKGLEYDPENVSLWHNLTLCHIQEERFADAETDLNSLLEVAPRYIPAYLMRGELALRQQDTLRAVADFDQAAKLDRYDPDVWATKGILHLQQAKYAEAEADLDKAINLSVQKAALYINRALARFHQNNLRGAMSDYDIALDIDPNNFIGHYNRGLLRAQVGDDNRAIEDFDFVVEADPSNMMARFNRGLLRAQIGDLKGAIDDYSAVINEYPNFWTGYQYRAEARRQTGDRRGAAEDEEKLMREQIKRHNQAMAGQNNSQSADDQTADNQRTRRKSDKDVNNFRKIVIADEEEISQKYSSEYRGKVQNRNVTVKPEPMFVLTYYEKSSEPRQAIRYDRTIDALNQTRRLPDRLLISNTEAPLTTEQIATRFSEIDHYAAEIEKRPDDALLRFARAIDFYLVQDFDGAIEDLTQAIAIDDKFFPAYFMRGVIRYKQWEYQRAEQESKEKPVSVSLQPATPKLKAPTEMATTYELVLKDWDKVIELQPDFVYTYFNKGNLMTAQQNYRAAIIEYEKAIQLQPDFAEAYFNRGLTRIFVGDNREGITDLSKAGELGMVSAYNIIKRFTDISE